MPLLPVINLGPLQVTRLIIGGNPFRGNSHLSKAMSDDMASYFTVARIKKALHHAEAAGINTVQARGDVLILQCIREYWDEGGTMQFIVQTASELRDLPGHVRHLARFGAKAIYVHGTYTDARFLEGDMSPVRDLLREIKDTGVQAGLGTHIPAVIDQAEGEGWEADFYMTCLYNLSVRPRQSAIVSGVQEEEVFDHEDKWKMFPRIRATEKPCLAFKVLGASRLCDSQDTVRKAFKTALSNIKPSDAMVVGMFPKYRDQIRENAKMVRELCRSDVG